MPEDAKVRARAMVAAAIKEHAALVRVNPPRTDECAADLDVVAPHAAAIRIPKCESADDVLWVAARAGGLPLVPAIETARGVLAAQEIACVPGGRAPEHRRPGPAARPLRRRRRPADALRPVAPGGRLPGRGAAAAGRQRLPADRRRRGAARRGGVRPVAGLRRRSPRSTRGRSRSCTRRSRRRRGNWSGRARCSRRSRPRAGGRPGSRTASSSTCRWPSARSGCWRSPVTSGGRTTWAPDPRVGTFGFASGRKGDRDGARRARAASGR